jgi:organic radical activating enzyme
MQENNQPIEKQILGDGEFLRVFKIWYTIQGEGPYAGDPAVFVRLAGCNLQCKLCDTDYSSVSQEMTVRETTNRIKEEWAAVRRKGMYFAEQTIRGSRPLVVLTGGEPFRQNITELANHLHTEGFRVQIETNGTLVLPRMPAWAFIVCSPKTPIIHKDLVRFIGAFKYVIENGRVADRDGLPTSILGEDRAPARPPSFWKPTHSEGGIFVQPCDSQDPGLNKLHTEEAVRSCMKFGYTLCLQTHKIAGLE